MGATVNNCKDEQILKELCSVFEKPLVQAEINHLIEDASSMDEAYDILCKHYNIAQKTAEFIMNMTFIHFYSLNYQKVKEAHESFISRDVKSDAASKLLEAQKQIQNRIDERAKEVGLYREGDYEPIYDGIYYKDAGLYLNSKMRIMWVLKEPYDDEYEDGEPCGGGWNYFDCFEPELSPWKIRTWKNMIYTTYGILNGQNMIDMFYIEDKPEMADVLKQIACINLSKMPGHTTTDNSLLPQYYETWKDILLDQIKLYAPQVIVFGNTFQFFKEDLFKGSIITPKLIDGITQLYIKDGIKYIDAYHPQCRISRDKYVDSIVNCIL